MCASVRVYLRFMYLIILHIFTFEFHAAFSAAFLCRAAISERLRIKIRKEDADVDVDAVEDAETDMPMHSGTSKSSAAAGAVFSLSLESIIKMFMRAANEVPFFGILEN